MKETESQQQRLGSFLRAHREMFGAPDTNASDGKPRRRTPGLRREELAVIAKISLAWYARLEQGKNVRPSPDVVDRLASALQLDQSRRKYLFELAGHVDPKLQRGPVGEVPPPCLRDIVNEMKFPAYVVDAFWNACMWNRSAERIFPDWLGGSERNLIRHSFLNLRARAFLPSWERRARTLVGQLRADYVRLASDIRMKNLIDGLIRESDFFGQIWGMQYVKTRGRAFKEYTHPLLGHLEFEQMTFILSPDGEFRLVILNPRGQTAARLME